MFFKIVIDHCSGGVYVYCVIQFILISLFILIVTVRSIKYITR